MTIKIAINGLGRIGRCVVRAVSETGSKDIEIVAINGGSGEPAAHAHFLSYDSVHGYFDGVAADGDNLLVKGKKIKLLSERDPKKLPWKELGVDLVMECTGAFKGKSDSYGHIDAGAKKIIISAPAEGVDSTIVYGVNNAALKKEHEVISIGSCTTNGLAPVAKVLNDAVGIVQGYMTTIHAYTNDQVILDAKHKDLRRARAGGLSMIPTSTGAAKALGLVLPELEGKLDGTAIRVPTPNVSMVDLTFVAGRKTSKDEVNEAIQKAANGALKGVLGYNTAPLVSIDFNHNANSSTFDATQTKVVGGNLVHVASWYDNEWGFSCRMLDVARLWLA
jgi:glyceraldehyde 3-phosphate dehydrogenase